MENKRPILDKNRLALQGKGKRRKNSRRVIEKPSYLSTPKQQLIKALSRTKAGNTSKGGVKIKANRFLSKAENQRSRLGLGETKDTGKKFTIADRPGKNKLARKIKKAAAGPQRRKFKNGKLVGGQNKLDANKDGKISKVDFALLKKKKKNK